MEFLERKAEEFIDLNQSAEFAAAERLVKKHTALLDLLKANMKKSEITKVSIRKGRILKRLSFDIRKMKRVDTNSLPAEIRDKYMKECDVWWKKVDVLDMDGIIEDVKEEETLGSGRL